MTDRFLLKVFTFVGINALVVIGLALLFGYAGQVSLGHAAFVGLGAYTCAYCTVELELAVARSRSSPPAPSPRSAGCSSRCPSLRLQGALPRHGDARLRRAHDARVRRGGAAHRRRRRASAASRSRRSARSRSARPPSLYWLVWGAVGIAVLVAHNVTSAAARARHARAARQRAGRAGVRRRHRGRQGADLRRQRAARRAGGRAVRRASSGSSRRASSRSRASITFLAMAVLGGTGSLAGPIVAAVAAHARPVRRRAHPRPAARDGADPPVVPGGHLRPRDHPRGDLRAARARRPVAAAEARSGETS